MNLGNKILELRKREKMSQEQLAEKLNVTRQTISNWELNETTPDIMQSKQLSKLFNVSLDELTSNDIKDILTDKISNTERLAGMIITILKVIGVLLIGWFILIIIAVILFSSTRTFNSKESYTTVSLDCQLRDKNYIYTIEYDEENKIISMGGDQYISDSIDTDKYTDALNLITDIRNFFENNDGRCD